MPAILDRCVKKVMKSGKDKSSAYAICSKSTGYVKKPGGKWGKRDESVTKSFIDLVNEVLNESYEVRGKRDGTGPYKDSFQRRVFGKGKRQRAGLTRLCRKTIKG